MPRFPIPDIALKTIYDLKPALLAEMDISLLFMDLDNTIATYSSKRPSVKLRNWTDSLKKAGIEPFILSNNRWRRPGIFANSLSIEHISAAGKPKTEKLLRVLSAKGIAPENAAIIGDQIFADVLCGLRAGITTISVRPVSLKNPLYFLRYGIESPFRFMRSRHNNYEKKER
ncbi:MAG: YqeG family HAD IIIA-type phosphatase [Oscillospiraceae bacterium]